VQGFDHSQVCELLDQSQLGDLLVDELLVDELLVDELLVDELLVDELLVDELLIDELLVDEPLIDDLSEKSSSLSSDVSVVDQSHVCDLFVSKQLLL
jgi:hypothetical protein